VAGLAAADLVDHREPDLVDLADLRARPVQMVPAVVPAAIHAMGSLNDARPARSSP
jgi:hypothetical protein